jgi:hypothetical protein
VSDTECDSKMILQKDFFETETVWKIAAKLKNA